MKISKENLIITIDSELASNSEAIARELSQALEIPCFGEEILDKAAELSGISAKLLHRYDGRAVHAAYDLLAEDTAALRMPPAADFITAQVMAARKLAENRPCILLDRHATMALADAENHVSIFVHAELEDRAKNYAEAHGVSVEEATETLKKADRAYRRYYKGNNKGWGEAESYDISINASDADAHTLAATVLNFLETMSGKSMARKVAGKAM